MPCRFARDTDISLHELLPQPLPPPAGRIRDFRKHDPNWKHCIRQQRACDKLEKKTTVDRSHYISQIMLCWGCYSSHILKEAVASPAMTTLTAHYWLRGPP